MAWFFVFLICTAVFVEGRPRHHKHKKADEATHLNDNTPSQAYYQPMDDPAKGPPQNINVYNMGIRKMEKDNKVTAQMDAHNVALTMQGPGVISVGATQQQVAQGDPKPDHTISVIKDTPSDTSYHVINVHSGHKLPIVLPLSELPSPQAAPKEGKSDHQQPPVAMNKDLSRMPSRQKPNVALQKGQQLPLAIKDENRKHAPSVNVHNKMTKEKADKVQTNLESSVPVADNKPKHEEQVVNGHKIKVTSAAEHQKVFSQMDPKNVALTVQGPGSASVTSNLKGGGSQTVIFDPRPYDPCPGVKCPKENGGNGAKK